MSWTAWPIRPAVVLGLVCVASRGLQAETYLCTDPTVGSVFTDSPSQLKHCQVLPRNATEPPRVDLQGVRPDAAAPMTGEGHLVVVPTPAISGEANADIIVPVSRSGRSLIVQARLNSVRDARLVLDTGADITVLSAAVARDLGLFSSARTSTMTLNTAGGQVRTDVVRIDSIGVGGAEVHDVPVAVHDLPDAPAGVDGLLGLTFLDKFLVTLDAQKGKLTLRRRESP